MELVQEAPSLSCPPLDWPCCPFSGKEQHTTMADPQASITGGVDTHKDLHVAAALDGVGRVLGTQSFPTTAAGYRALLRWLPAFGTVASVGVEGTGSWGAGLARHLAAECVTVLEVNRPNRQARRRRGKSEPADAEAAARAVLAQEATGTPKASNGTVEAVRLLRLARRSAMNARTQAANQIHSVIDTAPEELRVHVASILSGVGHQFSRPGQLFSLDISLPETSGVGARTAAESVQQA